MRHLAKVNGTEVTERSSKTASGISYTKLTAVTPSNLSSAFHPSEVNKWVVSCNRMSATSLGVVPSAECMLTGWRPGVVDWSGGVFAGCSCGSNLRYRVQWMATLALANQLPLPGLQSALSNWTRSLPLTGCSKMIIKDYTTTWTRCYTILWNI